MTELPVALRHEVEVQARITDSDGCLIGWNGGVVHVIDDEVPDNAHWKGWVW